MSARMSKLRISLSEAQNHRCAYCHCQMEIVWHPERKNTATVDHVIPKSKGGTDARENLISACLGCNKLRGNMRAQKFAGLMRRSERIGIKRAIYAIQSIQRNRSIASAQADAAA